LGNLMARAGNPFYYSGDQNLGQAVGASLGRALFGDPEMAAKLALQRAQMANYAAQTDEANAHAGLYGEQTTGARQKNTGSAKLSDLFAGMVPAAPVAAPAPPADPLAPLPDAAPAGPSPDQVRSSIPGLLSAMALARGDNVPVAETLAQLPAYFGDDELARRSMVAQGHTPGKEFAVTPERADDIAQQGYSADFNKDTSVARINHASDIPIANIQSGDRRYSTNVESGDRRRGQDLEHLDRVFGINVKAGADIANPAGANVLARALGPNATITSNARTPEEQRSVYATQHPGQAPVMDSAHLDAADGYPGFDVRPMPGMNFQQAREKVAAQAAAQGGYLRFAQDEGTHWHFDVRGVKSSTTKQAGGGTTKAISGATVKTIASLVDDQAKARGLRLDPRARQNMMTSAAKLFQQNGGNPNAAVEEVYGALQRNMAARQGGPTGDLASERQRAQAAIANGAPKEQVAQLFKQRTGQAL
jgi:hypothetical protein